MRCDAMIKGWLTTSMEKEIRTSFKYANTAAEIWSDLHERFGNESAPRAYELKQAISNTQQDGLTFLMGLDSEFLIVRNQILALKPAPSLGIAYHLVAEDEQQRSITSIRRLLDNID
ncbi:hypothetical protein Tco_1234747 [Tanacetum coccineum]